MAHRLSTMKNVHYYDGMPDTTFSVSNLDKS
jgi:hypothetical protein